MKIIFHEKFFESDYASNGSADPGRMEAIMDVISQQDSFEIIRPQPADEDAVLLAHTPQYMDTIRADKKLFDMALLAAGAAIMASDSGIGGEPAFACLRPPGHHAYRESSWGYCVFSNMGIALLRLKQQQRIRSAFILDFDAHTGDGTKAVLSGWEDCHILNPYADNSEGYIRVIRDYIRDIQQVDIVCVCAGFDSYEKDVGRKLTTSDFYLIGDIMKRFARRTAKNRRFAILEGGYYQPDLGKNVLAFCHGFM